MPHFAHRNELRGALENSAHFVREFSNAGHVGRGFLRIFTRQASREYLDFIEMDSSDYDSIKSTVLLRCFQCTDLNMLALPASFDGLFDTIPITFPFSFKAIGPPL